MTSPLKLSMLVASALASLPATPSLAADPTYQYVVPLLGVSVAESATQTSGAPATIAVSTSALSFTGIAVGQTSVAKTVLLGNAGTGAFSISSITASGAYTASHDCPSVLAVGDTCNVNVLFTPSQSGANTGTLSIKAGSSTQTIALSGTGTSLVTSVSFKDGSSNDITGLTFPSTAVGSNSTPVPVVITNTGATSIDISEANFQLSTGFGITNNTCLGATLAVGANCTLSLVFSPVAAQTYSSGSAVFSVYGNGGMAGHLSLTGTGTLSGVTKIVVGPLSSATFVLKSDGSWAASGDNTYGQLGIGSAGGVKTVFTAVPELAGATDLVLGPRTAFAQYSNGSWASTGDNSAGQLGTLDMTNRTRFTVLPAIAGATQVAAGALHTVVRKSTGAWVGIGQDSSGQLGRGLNGRYTSFVNLSEIAGASKVVVGEYFTFAQIGDGSWKATGGNSTGALGTGNVINRKLFSTISAISGATEVQAGQYHTYARLASGNWVGTGHNLHGQLGLGDTTNRSSFTAIPALTGASTLVVSGYSAFAKLSNGSWAVAGQNSGKFGLGTTSQYNSFTSVPALAGASSLLAGSLTSFAKMSDGHWYTAGFGASAGKTADTSTFTANSSLD